MAQRTIPIKHQLDLPQRPADVQRCERGSAQGSQENRMTVTTSMQDILATIQRNQRQIDLLTANSTQLTNFLLQQGLIQNLVDIAGLTGGHGMPEIHARKGQGLAPPVALASPVVSKTAPTTRKARGRRPGANVARKEATVPPDSNVARGRLQTDLMISWARRHRGVLNLSDFRAAREGKAPGVPDSFFTTTMYTKAKQLLEEGALAKEGPGHYRLLGSK
jgi:hypothetical protein